jgi:predicted transcriptional regulator
MTTETTVETTVSTSAILDAMTIDQTTSIVAAFVGHNDVEVNDIPALIDTVYSALTGLNKTQVMSELGVRSGAGAGLAERPPAVAIDKSVFPDYIVCLEDGKKLKMLKRHLQSAYQLTPEQYRVRWGLAPNYPMTAPSYAEVRSTLAKKSGLGTKAVGKTKKTVKKAVAPRKRAAK